MISKISCLALELLYDLTSFPERIELGVGSCCSSGMFFF